MPKKTVTFYIDREICSLFKRESIKRAYVISRLLENYMRKELKKWKVLREDE